MITNLEAKHLDEVRCGAGWGWGLFSITIILKKLKFFIGKWQEEDKEK